MMEGDRRNRGRAFVFPAMGVLALLGLWQLGHLLYGSLVLPSLFETIATLGRLVRDGDVIPALAITARDAVSGWLIGGCVGVLAGLLAYWREELSLMLQPIGVILLGIPAVVWVVLTLLWFSGPWAVIFTVCLATAPIVFSSTRQGLASVDGDLVRMAHAYRTPWGAMLTDLYVPHMVSHLFPVLASMFAIAWKVSVMAELFTGSGGIGDGIAGGRARLDTAETMAWVVVIVAVLIVVDFSLLRPLLVRLELWRGVERRRSSSGMRYG